MPPDASRWTLKLIKAYVPLLSHLSLGSIHHQLKRLGISFQRGRDYVHSPDKLYTEKVDYLMSTISSASYQDSAVLFADQLTYYNHASVAADWAVQKSQPLAKRAIGSKKQRRVAAAVDLQTGAITYFHGSKTRTIHLIKLYDEIVKRYADKKVIYLVVDNWPIHFHPDILACLVEQQTPFEFNVPPSWKELKAGKKYANRQPKLPIQLICLPTYASWLNPMEKPWKALKARIIHLHKHANNFDTLQEMVIQQLELWKHGSDQMLSYCGLLKKNGLYNQARTKFLANAPP